jgi:hypothetical protein
MPRKRRRHLPKVRGHGRLADGSNWFGGGAYGAQPWGWNSRSARRAPSKRGQLSSRAVVVGAILAAVLVIAVIAVR